MFELRLPDDIIFKFAAAKARLGFIKEKIAKIINMKNIPKTDMDKELIKSIRSIPNSYLPGFNCTT